MYASRPVLAAEIVQAMQATAAKARRATESQLAETQAKLAYVEAQLKETKYQLKETRFELARTKSGARSLSERLIAAEARAYDRDEDRQQVVVGGGGWWWRRCGIHTHT